MGPGNRETERMFWTKQPRLWRGSVHILLVAPEDAL